MRPIQTILLALIFLAAIPTPASAESFPGIFASLVATPADDRCVADPDSGDPGCDRARSPIDLTLGITDQDAFDLRHGPPGDTGSASDPAIGAIYDLVGDFEVVQIYWIDHRPARIQLLPFEEIAEDHALDLALAFLPDLGREDVETTRAEGLTGIVRFTGNSPTLAAKTDSAWYTPLDPSAAPGDCSITLYPGADRIAVIDIALGTGPDPLDE